MPIPKFRALIQHPIGAQPAAGRPVPEPNTELGFIHVQHFRSEMIPPFTTEIWDWSDGGNFTPRRRFCTYDTDGWIYPTLTQYPEGSIWDVWIFAVVGKNGDEGLTGSMQLGLNVYDDEGQPLASTEFPVRSRFYDMFGHQASACDRWVINVPPGGWFTPLLVVAGYGDESSVTVRVAAHSVRQGFDEDGFDPG